LVDVQRECRALAARCTVPAPDVLMLSNADELPKLHGAVTRVLNLALSWWMKLDVLELDDLAALVDDVLSVYQRLIRHQCASFSSGDPSVLMTPLIDVVRLVVGVDAMCGGGDNDDDASAATASAVRSVSAHAAVGRGVDRALSGEGTAKPRLAANSALWRMTVRQAMSTLFFGWAYFAQLYPGNPGLRTEDVAGLSAPFLRALDATRLPPGEAMASWSMMLKVVTDAVCLSSAAEAAAPPSSAVVSGAAAAAQPRVVGGAAAPSRGTRMQRMDSLPSVEEHTLLSMCQFRREDRTSRIRATRDEFESKLKGAVEKLDSSAQCQLWLSAVGLVDNVASLPPSTTLEYVVPWCPAAFYLSVCLLALVVRANELADGRGWL